MDKRKNKIEIVLVLGIAVQFQELQDFVRLMEIALSGVFQPEFLSNEDIIKKSVLK